MVGRSGPGIDQLRDLDHQDRVGGGGNGIELAGACPNPLRVLQLLLLLRLASQWPEQPAGRAKAWGLAAARGPGGGGAARPPPPPLSLCPPPSPTRVLPHR